MSATKPCAECGHGKSKHRKYVCAVHVPASEGKGLVFTGFSRTTKYCHCRGYQPSKSAGDPS